MLGNFWDGFQKQAEKKHHLDSKSGQMYESTIHHSLGPSPEHHTEFMAQAHAEGHKVHFKAPGQKPAEYKPEGHNRITNYLRAHWGKGRIHVSTERKLDDKERATVEAERAANRFKKKEDLQDRVYGLDRLKKMGSLGSLMGTVTGVKDLRRGYRLIDKMVQKGHILQSGATTTARAASRKALAGQAMAGGAGRLALTGAVAHHFLKGKDGGQA